MWLFSIALGKCMGELMQAKLIILQQYNLYLSCLCCFIAIIYYNTKIKQRMSVEAGGRKQLWVELHVTRRLLAALGDICIATAMSGPKSSTKLLVCVHKYI